MAGGRSRRMGRNKAFIEVDGAAIIERAARVLSSVFEDFFIVAGRDHVYDGLGHRVYTDIYRDAGSLGGVFTALAYAGSGACFVAACDMPFLKAGAVRAVADAALAAGDDYDAVVPHVGGRLHPMHAVYNKTSMALMEEMIKARELRIGDFLKRVRVLELTEEFFDARGVGDIAESVVNVNTAEDLERLGREIRGDR